MKLLKKDFRNGFAQIMVENLDDLWYASQIIDQGDRVSGKTERKIKIGKGENVKVERKVVYLKIIVEQVEFAKHSAVLRVSGKIVDGPEDIARGDYHTITASPEEHTVLGIDKEEWLNYQKMKLDEACKAERGKIMVVCFDREEASFALVKKYGFEMISEFTGEVEKKNMEDKSAKHFYDDIIKSLEEYDKRYKLQAIILASPAFFKEDLFKKMTNPSLKKKVHIATCSTAGKSGIAETLKRDEVRSLLSQERAAEEMKVVEEILKEISTSGKASYGMNEVAEKAGAGAVLTLAVTDEFIMKRRQEGSFGGVERMMKAVDRAGGSVMIIASEHDGGRKLDGLGGIAALLRYKSF